MTDLIPVCLNDEGQAHVAEKILRAAGFKVVRLWDLNEPGWCMLTDYQSEAWTDD